MNYIKFIEKEYLQKCIDCAWNSQILVHSPGAVTESLHRNTKVQNTHFSYQDS
jgi:hypothetical protein